MRPRHSPLSEGVIDLQSLPATHLYRAYTARGDLLYIGVAENLASRLRQHRRDSSWYAKASCVEWETYPTRAIALELEAELIRSLCPPYNTVHNHGHRPSIATLAEFARAHSPVAHVR